MELPQTLHAQLYLLAYDCERHSFGFERWELLGLALRAAMLSDLYLTGHLVDEGGKARSTKSLPPADLMLRGILETAAGRSWAQLITGRSEQAGVSSVMWRDWALLSSRSSGSACAPRAVRGQLEAAGLLVKKRSRTLGVIPTERFAVYDESIVTALADRVTAALRDAVNDRPADPRPLAVGLLAVQAQMPVLVRFLDDRRHREQLRQMVLAAIEPVSGLRQVIESHHEDLRRYLGS